MDGDVPSHITPYYKVVRTLGTGSFGKVIEGVDVRTGKRVAIKLEDKSAEFPQLLYEARIMEKLGSYKGFPELYWFSTFHDWNILVMPLLGKSLEEERVTAGGSLPLDTVMEAGRQGLDRLRVLHEFGWSYRDIKPENFMWHTEHGKRVLYIIDFGLCKRMIYPGTSSHIAHRTGKTLTGTPRYASLRAHEGREQSRRDDLESFMYMLVYLIRGVLPWQRIKITHGALSDNNYGRIAEVKRSVAEEVLCEGLPKCFLKTLMHAKSLSFEDMPDYHYLGKLWS